MPIISVIIPAYNAEKTIKQTIQSVLKQTFTDFELIIINDGSTDSTPEIINSINDERIKVFSFANSGLACSRNRGIDLAKGEYISFLDADDLWTSNKLELQLKALQKNPEAKVAYSWVDYIDENGSFLYPGNHVSFSGNVYEQLLLTNFIENGSNVLIKMDAIQKVGNFDTSLIASEDWEFFLRLGRYYHFVVVPLPQILYRQITASMSSKILQQETQCLKVINRAFENSSPSLQKLKPKSIANLYTYLTFKALQGNPTRQKSLIAARFLWTALKNNPLLFQQRTKLIFIVWLKIIKNIAINR